MMIYPTKKQQKKQKRYFSSIPPALFNSFAVVVKETWINLNK